MTATLITSRSPLRATIAASFIPQEPISLPAAFANQRFQRGLAAPPGKRRQPFDWICESPAYAAFALQVATGLAALVAIPAAHRGFNAYTQNL